MHYHIEILTNLYHLTKGDIQEWRAYKSPSGTPYHWSTETEAYAMLKLRFPSLESARFRIVKSDAMFGL